MINCKAQALEHVYNWHHEMINKSSNIPALIEQIFIGIENAALVGKTAEVITIPYSIFSDEYGFNNLLDFLKLSGFDVTIHHSNNDSAQIYVSWL